MRSKSAFTLIELLVVIAIIGMLATVSVIALSNARAKSRDAKRAGDMKQVQTALELFFNDNNRYPTVEEWNTGRIGSAVSGVTSTYMQIIPTAPTPADGNCTDGQNSIAYSQTEDGSSYTISFCFGANVGALPGGPKCLTPGGIIDIDCAAETEDPGFVCGDGVSHGSKTYPTVLIGSQCWFVENLNVGTRINGASNQGNYSSGIQKYCYNDSEANCSTDGGLYQWHMAAGKDQDCDVYDCASNPTGDCCVVTGSTLCPSGWHVSTHSEWETLVESLGGNPVTGGKIKSATPSWDGTNTSGFSALPAGFRIIDGSFGFRGDYGIFWTTTFYSDSFNYSWNPVLQTGLTSLSNGGNDRANGFSVRCLQD